MKTTILEDSTGRLYEIPNDLLAKFAVPGAKVAELRQRAAAAASQPAAAAGDGANGEHAALGELPADHPGYAQQQAILAAMKMARAEAAGGAGAVTLNIYVGGGPVPQIAVNGNGVQVGDAGDPADSGVEGYHMSFDENGIPVMHSDMLWGDYIDRQGNPAVGFHSHDPVHGNAQ